MIIDGIPVTDEEKAKAELYFMDQQVGTEINPIALRMAKTLWSFGCSDCNRVSRSRANS